SYLDPHVSLDDARHVGAADERVEQITGADVIVLATPVDVAVNILRTLETTAVVTSTCSVMRALRDVVRGTFVAGHPMAGSHERGLAAARADLFEGKPWFVDAEHELVDGLVRDCGAVLERASADEHDATVALTSHLPQVLSTALAAYLEERPEVLRFAGSGLRTFLRLAGSDASVWSSVLDANRDQIVPHADAVAAIAREIVDGNASDAFKRAQSFWRKL
ncbi:MAG TPA: prephenate dehydrogenase/arogenate dehydrogenase family protein, partial [Thermoanaerobaculia bacterium]|nr:prephenate dehydrogenase/arogenate dehydrogenase family protein [Thermoanaerobaculia bacterium]